MSEPTESERREYHQTGLYVRGSNGLKLRDQRVRRLVQRMRVAMPWLKDSDAPVCRAWAELEALATRVYVELRDRGLVNTDGDARRLLDDYRKLRATQILLSRELGMTPTARLAIEAALPKAAATLDIATYRNTSDENEKRPD